MRSRAQLVRLARRSLAASTPAWRAIHMATSAATGGVSPGATFVTAEGVMLTVEDTSHATELLVRIGLSDAALDDIGDPSELCMPGTAGTPGEGAAPRWVPAGTPLCSVRWTGYCQTAADELYHTGRHPHGRGGGGLPAVGHTCTRTRLALLGTICSWKHRPGMPASCNSMHATAAIPHAVLNPPLHCSHPRPRLPPVVAPCSVGRGGGRAPSDAALWGGSGGRQRQRPT